MTQSSTPSELTIAQQLSQLVLSMRKLAPQGPPGAAHDKDHVHHQQLHFLFLLSHLTRDKGSVRPSDLSTAMHITRGAVTHTLNVMESTGLILRKTDPSDRRNVLVTITPIGQERMDRQRALFLANMQNLVDHLGEEDARTLVRILTVAVPFLQSQLNKPGPQ